MKKLIVALLVTALCLSLCAHATPAEDSDVWVQAKAKTALCSEPVDDAPAVKDVPKGAELEYLDKSEDGKWYRVAYKGVKGWVSTRDAALMWSTFY